MTVNSMNTTRFGTPGKGAHRRSAEERRCAAPECTTILSTYNASTTCYLHTEPHRLHPLATR